MKNYLKSLVFIGLMGLLTASTCRKEERIEDNPTYISNADRPNILLSNVFYLNMVYLGENTTDSRSRRYTKEEYKERLIFKPNGLLVRIPPDGTDQKVDSAGKYTFFGENNDQILLEYNWIAKDGEKTSKHFLCEIVDFKRFPKSHITPNEFIYLVVRHKDYRDPKNIQVYTRMYRGYKNESDFPK